MFPEAGTEKSKTCLPGVQNMRHVGFRKKEDSLIERQGCAEGRPL